MPLKATLPLFQSIMHPSSSLSHGISIIQQVMNDAPHAPGIYRMWDKKDDLLYVGKAKSLKNRLHQYCRKSGHSNRIMRLISDTARCNFLLTRNEAEALLLESNLIKAHHPRFNVLLKDDKSYPFIYLETESAFPRLRLHRGARKGKGRFFGPFATTHAVRQTLELLERAFLLRSCPDTIFNNRSRPCLLYQIKRCTAPCVGKISSEDYHQLVEQNSSFLSGKSEWVRKKLTADMNKASQKQNFEKAAVIRDRINAISRLQSHQSVNVPQLKDADVFALWRVDARSCVEVFFFRGGRHHGNQALFPHHDSETIDEKILSATIAQFYDDKPTPPHILVSHNLGDKNLLEQALSTSVHHPQRGALRSVIDHALTNARASFIRKSHVLKKHDYHNQLAKLLSLSHVPSRIEIYDNSHFKGSHAVGVMVVADEHGFVKNNYRRFNIRQAKPEDDIAMMREVLERRLKRLLIASKNGKAESSFEEMPSLMLLDGGTAQLQAGMHCLADCGLAGQIALAAIAKGKEGRSGFETLYSINHPPISMRPNMSTNMGENMGENMSEHNDVFSYLRRLRDEAHRYAIGSHRHLHLKDVRKSQLDAIPHIGPKRKKALLEHFGDVATIAQAAEEDLCRVRGISHNHAKTIFEWFHES